MIRNSASSMLAALVLAATLAPQGRAQVEFDNVYSDKLQKAYMETVVRIKAERGRQILQGTGVCVAYNAQKNVAVILTGAHVVKGAKRLSFEVFTSASYPNPARRYISPQAKWWWNAKDDVAVIVVRMWVPRTAPLAKNPAAIRKGDHVFSVGCGLGAPPVSQVGDIAAISKEGDYVVGRGAIFGRSGGPLIGRQGVIGIASRSGNGATVFVGLNKIHGLLKQVADSLRR
jgi:hypothetical protein